MIKEIEGLIRKKEAWVSFRQLGVKVFLEDYLGLRSILKKNIRKAKSGLERRFRRIQGDFVYIRGKKSNQRE